MATLTSPLLSVENTHLSEVFQVVDDAGSANRAGAQPLVDLFVDGSGFEAITALP